MVCRWFTGRKCPKFEATYRNCNQIYSGIAISFYLLMLEDLIKVFVPWNKKILGWIDLKINLLLCCFLLLFSAFENIWTILLGMEILEVFCSKLGKIYVCNFVVMRNLKFNNHYKCTKILNLRFFIHWVLKSHDSFCFYLQYFYPCIV